MNTKPHACNKSESLYKSNNIKYTCREFSCYVSNLYRGYAQLFVLNSKGHVGVIFESDGGFYFYACGITLIVRGIIYSTDEDDRTDDFAKNNLNYSL